MKLIIFYVLLLCSAVVNAQYFEVPSAGSEPTKTFLIEAPKSKATVVFFQGGDGVLNIQPDGSNNRTNSPMIRSGALWKQYGINYVMVDSPYDLGDYRRTNKRGDADHLDRAEAVVRFYKNKFNVPIWIYGHSMGTVTVTKLANRSGNSLELAGVIIAGTHDGETVSAEFNKPVLAIHHKREACPGTPISASEAIIKSRPASTKSELVMIDGGDNTGHPCAGLAYHGFNNVEDQVVDAAAKFILSH